MSVEAPLSMALLAGRLPPGSVFAPSGAYAITTVGSAPGGIFKDPAARDFKIDETVKVINFVAMVHELTAFSVRLAKGASICLASPNPDEQSLRRPRGELEAI